MIPVAGQQILRIEQRGQLHNNAVWNVHHFLTDTPVAPDGFDELADAAATSWAAEVCPTLSSEYTVPEVAIQQVFPSVGVLIVQGTAAGGALAEQAVANQQALCVSLITLDPGRRARGRTFIGGCCEIHFDGNTGLWQDVHTANMAAGIDDYLFGLWASALGLAPIIWSTGAAPPAVPEFFPVLTTIGRRIPASLRSRKIGRGI